MTTETVKLELSETGWFIVDDLTGEAICGCSDWKYVELITSLLKCDYYVLVMKAEGFATVTIPE